MAAMHHLEYELRNSGHHIEHLDVGGGPGIPFMENDKFPSLDHCVEEMQSLKRKEFQYYVEPGHALCHTYYWRCCNSRPAASYEKRKKGISCLGQKTYF